jgi:hypothetical protein
LNQAVPDFRRRQAPPPSFHASASRQVDGIRTDDSTYSLGGHAM